MRITVVGRGNLGGGAGGPVGARRPPGDAARPRRRRRLDADAVLVAVPGGAIAEAFDRLRGFEGKTMIDATNLYNVTPPGGFASNAEFVKSKTKGPTAKSFNVNFASLFGRLGDARARPATCWCGDDEAREVVEQLNRDAGYDPVRTGPLENAAAQEGLIGVIFGIAEGMGPCVYRFAPVDRL